MARPSQIMTEQDRRAAWRRGKILTAVMVILTAASVFIPAVVKLFTDHSTHDWSDFVFGPVLLGLLIWFALRGESISTGCLMAFYALVLSGPVLLVIALALVYFVPQAFTSSDGSHPQLGPPDWHNVPGVWETLGLIAAAAQVVFSLWVLFFSRDVRFYRASRRRGIHSADDPALAAPEPPPLPASLFPPLLSEHAGRVACPPVSPEIFRRGQLLTLIVVLVTAALCLWPEVRNVWFGYPPDKVPTSGESTWGDLVVSGLIIGSVSWCAWRGGRNSSGCLAIFYSLGLAMVALGAVLTLLSAALGRRGDLATYQDFGLTIKGIGHSIGGTLAFVGLGAWTFFAFWVLVRSRDARAYRLARQRGTRSVADSFNEWHLRRH